MTRPLTERAVTPQRRLPHPATPATPVSALAELRPADRSITRPLRQSGQPRPAGEVALDGVIARGTAEVGARFDVPALELDVGALLDRVADGYARVGIGFRPGSRLGAGVRVPGERGARPALFANSTIAIREGRWVPDGAQRGGASDERTLIHLSDAQGEPAELDGPLWFDPDRLYMTGDGRILADVPCLPDRWFDFTEEITGQERIDPSQAGNLARALLPEPLRLGARAPEAPGSPGGDAGAGDRGGATPERSPQVQRIIDALAFDSFQIFGAGGTLQPGRIRLGSGEAAHEGIFLNLAAGPDGALPTVHTEGNLDRLTTRIEGHFSSFDMSSQGTRVYSGAGRAEIEVTTRFHRREDGTFDFDRTPEVEIQIGGLRAEGVNIATPGPRGERQRIRVGRIETSSDDAPEITIGRGVTHLNFDDVDLYDVHGTLEVAGNTSSVRLGSGDGAGEGVDIENVNLRYDSASRVFEVSGEPVDFEARVDGLDLIDGDVADVELDVALGNGLVQMPGRSQFSFRSGQDGELRLGRFRFEGTGGARLGRLATEEDRDPENQLSGFLNQVSLGINDSSAVEVTGDSLVIRPGELPLMQNVEIDVAMEVDELGIPAGFEEPIRFFGGTGGRLTLHLDRGPEDTFLRGGGSFEATFNGEARARSQRIRGLEGALVNTRADGGNAELRGDISFDPDGRLEIELLGEGRPTIDIEMERGDIEETERHEAVERRFEPLPPHERIEVDAPRAIPERRGQSAVQHDVGEAVSALVDTGRLSVTLPMEVGGSGPFTIDLTESRRVRLTGQTDLVGFRVEARDIGSGGGDANLNLTFEQQEGVSLLDIEHSGIELDTPIEFDLSVRYDTPGPFSVTAPTIRGQIRGVSFTDAGDGQVRVIPDVELDEVELPLGLDATGLARNFEGELEELLGEHLVAHPLFGRTTLPGERDRLVDALREGAFGQAMGPTGDAPPAAGASTPRSATGATATNAPPATAAAPIESIVEPGVMLQRAFPELPPIETDLEGDLLRLAEERSADLPAQERRNLLTAVERMSRIFDVDGTTLRVRDSDGDGPIEVGDRRLELGGGQYIDLAPGTELEVDIDPQEGVVVRGRAELDGMRIGAPDDDIHVDLGRLTTNLELRVVPTARDGGMVTAIALSEFEGDINRIRAILGSTSPEGDVQSTETMGVVDVRDATLGAHENNVFTLSFGAGRPVAARFYLPEIETARLDYQHDLSLLRPDWEDARLDIRDTEIRDAALLFDGQTITTLEPLQVRNLDAYVSNIHEQPYDEQEVVLDRARIHGAGQILLLPGANIGLYAGETGDEEAPTTMRVEGVAGAFDLVTTGPRARIPLLEDAHLHGWVSTLQFGQDLGTQLEFVRTLFSGETGEGEVIVGPEGSQRETMDISSGRVVSELERLRIAIDAEEMADAREEGRTPGGSVYLDARYDIDGEFSKGFLPTPIQSETLEELGVQLESGGSYEGRFFLSGAVHLDDDEYVIRNQATLEIRAEALLRANGIDPEHIRETLERWLREAIENPPNAP